MNLAQRTQALLAVVERYRADRCVAVLEPADAEARRLLRTALADGRRRVATAIAEERKRLASVIGALEAALQTERRLCAQRHEVHLLARAWQSLQIALAARWIDPEGRQRWVETHLARARAAFARNPGRWLIRHHGAWTADEQQAAAARLKREAIDAEFVEDAQIGAGFVVVRGNNVLDASLEGLLADRAVLEGRLLQLLEEVPA
jgi:hypothetical protein